MDIKLQNKIKLRENECVYPATAYEDFLVRQQFSKMGATWGIGFMAAEWSAYARDGGGGLYVDDDGDLLHGAHGSGISAIEWLNRHGIFVYGQNVLVRDNENQLHATRTYIAPYVCVSLPDDDNMRNGAKFDTCTWAQFKSPFKPWVDIDEEPRIELTINGKPVELSAETLAAIRAVARGAV